MRKIIGLGAFVGLAALLGACSAMGRLPSTAEGETVLEVSGAVKGGPYRLGRADLARLPRRSVRGTDPTTGTERLYEGVSLLALAVERVELAPGADVVVVRTSDKAAVVVPIPVIRQLRPVLADQADGTRIPARVLAWPTADQPGLERDPRAASWWARDVTALELAEWRRSFGPALAAPEGATDSARRGSAWYGERCISCHRMRGVGGDRGPELTQVASRLDREPFLHLLEGHPGWSGLRGGDPPGPRDADDVWSFLRAVAESPVRTVTNP